MFGKIISASLSPNTEFSDVWLALKMLFRPWNWKQGASVKRIEEYFTRMYPQHRAISFNSGRSALYAILKAFGFKKGDEVMLQAFTCVAVPNSVLWSGATPIYVDVDNTLNLDIEDVKKKLTKRTRAIIIQHTLGITAQMDSLVEFAKKNNLLIIEDCAHSLGAISESKKIGSFGDASFFSFGRDKVVSSVFGGVALIHKRHNGEWLALKEFHKRCPQSGMFWIFQQLLHPVLFAIILPFYRIGIGKLILILAQRAKLLSIPVYPEEKLGKRPNDFPSRYPNALAQLLVLQLKKLERYNTTRQNRADFYKEALSANKNVELLTYSAGSIYLRFPLLVSNPSVALARAKKSGILLGNWYHNVIDPTGADFGKIQYSMGSCPKSEYIAKHIINLPTRITQKEARRVVHELS